MDRLKVATRLLRLAKELMADFTGKVYVLYVQDGKRKKEGPFDQRAAKKRFSELLGNESISSMKFERAQ